MSNLFTPSLRQSSQVSLGILSAWCDQPPSCNAWPS